MRPRILSSASLVLTILFLSFCTQTFPSRTRLSGMGELSIVIEDESNMINLWDFARNPAGFLTDEKGSVVRTDILWDTYQIEDLLLYSSLCGYKDAYTADGDQFESRLLLGIRRPDFAFALEAKHLSLDFNSWYRNRERESPGGSLVLSKRLNSTTALGARLSYFEEEFESEYFDYFCASPPPHMYFNLRTSESEIGNFSGEIGLENEFNSNLTVGAVLGYDTHKPGADEYVSECYTWRLSAQAVVKVDRKLKLGVETVYALEKGHFWEIYPTHEPYDLRWKQKYRHSSSSVKFRGAYDFSTKLTLGFFFWNREPLDGLSNPAFGPSGYRPYQAYLTHFASGLSYRFNKHLVAGVEFHFRDTERPNFPYAYPWGGVSGPKRESLNLGVEGKIGKSLLLRGGFMRTEFNENPNLDKRRNGWENRATFGFGYQPAGPNPILDVCYSYAFEKHEQYGAPPDAKSDRHVLCLSFKKLF